MERNCVLGIDVGSVAVSAVVLGPGGEVRGRSYSFHRGDLRGAVARLDGELDLSRVGAVALTGRPPANLRSDGRYEERIASLAGLRRRYPGMLSFLVVGGENFALHRFSAEGEYLGLRSSTSCAAGTGGFLDQQAGRLALGGPAELARLAEGNRADPPKVATRCAVFAKTDLIHAQQEGHSLPAIADGLCRGLAKNLVDTLFKDELGPGPVVFSGGVALNGAVLKAVAELAGVEVVPDAEAPYHGAYGAAVLLAEELASGSPARRAVPFSGAAGLWEDAPLDRSGFHPPLRLELSDYPDFGAHESFRMAASGGRGEVEVDVYGPVGGPVWLGVDVGSTSTKAACVGRDGEPVAGFYTRTAGRPVEAVQALLEAAERLGRDRGASWEILGCATTGSGRKLSGAVLGADLVLDEISAHARAAAELDPEVDTIIEIGGQDSKFTALSGGRVTSSVMNNVCAAGTGSFIEEQARRLGVATADCAAAAEGQRAPRVSDRCTVFMERDINHFLARGCSTGEVLAAALHAVRENYLRKVAAGKEIGRVVFFQGATAKNRALVASFEQGLGRPIKVSPYCHLTGAYGAALCLRDEVSAGDSRPTAFRGLGLHSAEVPVRSEVCGLCSNHCKLTVAEVGGEEVAYGFLCGRDYGTDRYVAATSTDGPDRLRERAERDAEAETAAPSAAVRPISAAPAETRATVGLPFALALVEDHAFWRLFFESLGVRVVSGKPCRDSVKLGKERSGAEFCAPVSAFYGQALRLLEEADYVFAPVYLERPSSKGDGRRQYCYYSQFSSSLVALAGGPDRFLMPLVESAIPGSDVAEELRRCLADKPALARSRAEIRAALDRARAFRSAFIRRLAASAPERPTGGDIGVVLLGRPYVVLNPDMNKGIPAAFARLGIEVLDQDALKAAPSGRIDPLLRQINWEHGRRLLSAAEAAALSPARYPVLLTSFKCSPDSFIVDAFKRLMDAYGKPYLVLELDEHDSSVGYETRIEAAVRAFRNHASRRSALPRPDRVPDLAAVNPHHAVPRAGKTLFLPCWDPLATPLLAATLRSAGVDALPMEETEESIRASLSTNSGQCIPLNVIAESFVRSVRKAGRRPEDCAVWLAKADFSCNIPLYAYGIQAILDREGGGFERSGVYVGELSFVEISPLLGVDAYLAYLVSGLLRRLACRMRPYELEKGAVDRAVAEALAELVEAFGDRKRNKVQAVEDAVEAFAFIPYDKSRRGAKVGIFGDFYVRDNDVMNQDLVRYVESRGGEIVSMPYSEYARMVADAYFSRWKLEGRYGARVGFGALLAAAGRIEKVYYRIFARVLGEEPPRFDDDPAEILAEYGVRIEHSGESSDNLLKAWYLKKRHPDIALFVQLSPAFCCAGLVTEAMKSRIEETVGVPVVALTYDGTGGSKNEIIGPYLAHPRRTASAVPEDAREA